MRIFQGENQMQGGMPQEAAAGQNPEIAFADTNCKEAENVVHSAIQDLGRMYFEAYKDDPGAEYAEIIARIKKNMETEQLWRQYRLSLEDKTQCEKCGTVVTSDSLFCKKCGSSIPSWDFSSLGVEAFKMRSGLNMGSCPNCGRPLVAGAVFCEGCGTKVG